jgi:gamma-glutamylaminecyclotransferase
MDLLFAYGSLKAGFPNAHVNAGIRLAGDYTTRDRLPLYLVGEVQLPCLLLEPGQGLQVVGQLFRVDDAALAAMDRLERVGQPGGYRRVRIEVLRLHDRDVAPIEAHVYVQQRSRLQGPGPLIGPIAEYTLEHARKLAW